MRRKTFISLLVCLLLPLGAGAAGPVRFGVEWGFSATIFNARNFNYLDSDGARLVDDSRTFKFYPNGTLLGRVGIALGDRVTLSLCSGYLGVEDNVRVIPALFRAGYDFGAGGSGGAFCFVDAGVGFRDTDTDQRLGLASLGGGYRIALNRQYGIDLSLSVRSAFDHPRIDSPMVSSNSALYSSVNVSVGISF